MKKLKHLIAALIAGLVTTGCQQPELPETTTVQNPNLTTVNLRVPQFTITTQSFGPTRAYADVKTLVSRIDLWAISDGDTLQVHQSSADDDFGNISFEVDRTREYHLYAVAHKGAGQAELADSIISFPADKVTHSLWYATTFRPDTTQQLDCHMNRMVGQFFLDTTDAAPEELHTLRFLLPATYTRWTLSGHGCHSTQRTHDVTISSRRADGSLGCSLYIIAADTEATYDITVQALDAQGQLLQQREFADVPIQNGYKTSARGQFFTAATTRINLTVQTDWQEKKTIAY